MQKPTMRQNQNIAFALFFKTKSTTKMKMAKEKAGAIILSITVTSAK